jgi:hypothetical protein
MWSLRTLVRGLASAPLRIPVPRSKLQISHARSSGPGGQNVNKVNTKVELRFNVKTADWLPDDVRARLEDDQRNRINKQGELVVTASDSRSQASNFDSALSKIQQMVDEACIPPKARIAAPPIPPRQGSQTRDATGTRAAYPGSALRGSLPTRAETLAPPLARAPDFPVRPIVAGAPRVDGPSRGDKAETGRLETSEFADQAKPLARRLLSAAPPDPAPLRALYAI